MMLAWAASIAAQAALVFLLARSGRIGPWTQYLAWGVSRSILLWCVPAGIAYWWAWTITEPVNMLMMLRAAGHAVERADQRMVRLGMLMAAGMFAGALSLTPHWSPMLRSSLLVRQATVYLCFGSLTGALVAGHPVSRWMLTYFVLSVISLSAATVEMSRAWLGWVNLLHLSSVAVLFAAQILHEGRVRNEQQRQQSG